MKVVKVTVTRYEGMDGIQYEDAEKACKADLCGILEPDMFRNMSAGDVADILWKNRRFFVAVLIELDSRLAEVEDGKDEL